MFFMISYTKTVYHVNSLNCHMQNFMFVCFFYAPEGTSGGILKSHHPSVRQSVRPSVTNRVSAISHKLLKQI